MPANECIPFKKPGVDPTGKATAQITGKRFVKISGNRTGGGAGGLSSDLANVYQIAPCTAAAQAVGVARYDGANGSLVPFIVAGVVPVTAGGTIAAGAQVESDANGQAVTLASGKPLGIALTGAASGADAEILLNIG